MSSRLSIRGLSKNFGGLAVSRDVSFDLAAGARTALIGPNGAGKTTLVNMISGALRPSAGSVHLDGDDITGIPEQQRARRGIVRSYQTSRLFRSLTVAENLRIALLQEKRAGWRLRWKDVEAGIEEALQRMLDVLGLAPVAGRVVDRLSLGEQRLVEIALALALRPRVLLLDEPAAGVPHGETEIIFAALRTLPDDLSILLIEHDMDIVFRFAREIVVLVSGAVLTIGTPEQVASDERVRDVYFGRAGAGR